MYIEIDNIKYEIVIEKKKIKHTYIRVKDDLKVHVTTSRFSTKSEVINVIEKEVNAIKKMINRQKKRNQEENLILGNPVDIVVISNQKKPEYENGKLYIKDRTKLDNYYKIIALDIFKKRLDYLYEGFEENIPYPVLKIRKMKSRWGVCNRKNKSITLNLELLKKDYMYIDYVIVHELCHFIHFNHSSSFWGLVEKYITNYKIIRKKMRE